jgi:hypothetical protein
MLLEWSCNILYYYISDIADVGSLVIYLVKFCKLILKNLYAAYFNRERV